MHNRGVIASWVLVFWAFSLSSVGAHELQSNGQTVPELLVHRINSNAPNIDGYLNDEAWQAPEVTYARNFIQHDPDEGEAASESTLVAMLFDDDAVYVGFWCFDSQPEKIDSRLVRRDRHPGGDYCIVRLDCYHDHQTGVEFTMNPSGVQGDTRLYNDDHSDDSWDAVWSGNGVRQPWGWSAEFRIPYHCLRFTEQPEHVWGADFVRVINRTMEVVQWSFRPSSESGRVSWFGHLTGISDIRPARHLEFLPFVVSRLETEPETLGNPDGRDFFGNAGLDIKYGISSNLTLDATINPDFGQVELDRPILNLSTFETWYPERRPFFMEGAELYQSEYTLFYSRRIGRSPRWRAAWFDSEYSYTVSRPDATTILGAAKLTGKLGGQTSFAFLNAVTEEETETYQAMIITPREGNPEILDTTYTKRELMIEPLANYSILRVKQDIFDNSHIGGMLTLDAYKHAIHPGLAGGIDWRLITADGGWGFRGQGIFSRNDSETTGFGVDAIFDKLSGEHFRGSVGLTIEEPELDNNRLGYNPQRDQKAGWLWMQYRTRDDWWVVRNTWNNFNAGGTWNFDGANISRYWNVGNTTQFINNFYAGFGYAQNFQDYDDRETRGRGLWKVPKSWNAWLWFDTDDRKKFLFEADLGFGESRTSPWWTGELYLRYRPTSAIELSTYGVFTHDFGQLMWVDNPGDTMTVFADKDQDIFDLSISASILFHRNLSLQISANGLLTGLNYQQYRPYQGHGNYGEYLEDFDFYDYNYTALNSTVLLRWEYLPGSTLYLVWTRSRSEFDPTVNNLDLSRDLKRLFSSGSTNLWLIKASYWWNI